MGDTQADSRRRRLLGIAAGTVGLGVAAALSWWQAGEADRVPEAFWRETLLQPDGTPLDLQSWRGHPVLINFWATWCPPCVKELPEINEFYEKNASGSAKFLAFAVDKIDAVQRFLVARPLSLPVAVDAGRGLAWVRAFGSADGALPLTIILDADGGVRFRKIGRLMPSDYRAWPALLA